MNAVQVLLKCWRVKQMAEFITEAVHAHQSVLDGLKQYTPESQLAHPTTTTWTGKHYDKYYQLTPEDISSGKIKIDAYFVSNMWKLGEKDNTGVLFHNLKTIARFGEKNGVEREICALYNQTKRLAELHGVDLK